MPRVTIATVSESDLDDLLPLLRAYCDFYDAAPTDNALLAVSRALIADPELEGLQLLARAADAQATGFATVFWSWNTLKASRLGVMHDLYVDPRARGTGLAERLIAACVEACRNRGDVAELTWQTARDNVRAQAVYDRVGGHRAEWVDYSLPIDAE